MFQNKDNDRFAYSFLRYFQVLPQKIGLSINLFAKNELFNHAGAAAFFFIVSIPPVFLLLLIIAPYIFEELLQVNPSFSKDIIHLLCDRLNALAPNR